MKLLEFARPGDWAALNRIAVQVNDLHAQWDVSAPTDVVYPDDFFQEMVEMDQLLVARRGGVLVGYVRFYLWETSGTSVKRKFLTIDDVGVEESLRGQGIGKQMMADLRSYALSSGCTDLQLFVDAHNENALAFYQKCGLHISNYGMQAKL